MKKTLVTVLFTIVVFNWCALPTDVKAFSFTANNFAGYLAYDEGGDVIGTYGLDPRFSYENTGMYFNTAAGLAFDFLYVPTYPTVEDVAGNPMTEWLWTFSVTNLTLPWEEEPLPDLVFSHKASFNDIMEGANWAYGKFQENFPYEICYYFDYTMTGPGSGTASLSLAANIDPELLPECAPEQFMYPYQSDAEVSLTVEPIPEPISLVLFGAGLVGMGLVRRRKA